MLKDVRVQVDSAYHTLAELINAHATVARANNDAEAVAVYDDFIGRLNQRLDLLNNALARHRGQTKKTEDTTPEN